MKITKCCCCLSIVQGAYIIAIFGIIRGIFYLSFILSSLGANDWAFEDLKRIIEETLLNIDCAMNKNDSKCQVIDNKNSDTIYDHDVFMYTYIKYCIIVGTILFAICHIILLIGLIKKYNVFLLIWLIVEGIATSV